MPLRTRVEADRPASRQRLRGTGLVLAAALVWGGLLTSAWGALGSATEGGAGFTLHRLGSPDDVTPRLRGPAFYLKGDGPPEPTSFGDFVGTVSSDLLDVVILGASYADRDEECRLLGEVDRVNSCTTLVLRDPGAADDPAVVQVIDRAEVVYFRGGDQCNFVHWKDSALQEAVRRLVARGGGTGGGSAGLAIQGALAVYDGCSGSVSSAMALANPYRRSISFTHDYFAWPHLEDTVTDSHFVRRDRMGRLMTFLCRQQALGRTERAWGLGIEEGSVVVIDRQGQGRVHGEVAFVVEADGSPAGCQDERRSLTYEGFKVWRLDDGATFDFAHRPASGYYRIDVTDGLLSADPYLAPAQTTAVN